MAYWDALFEDARMALWLALQAQDAGAHVLNHAEVVRLQALGHGAFEVTWRDRLGGSEHVLRAGCVINAAGVWVDRVRGLQGQTRNDPSGSMRTIGPSQGIHLVLRWPQGAPEHLHALLSPRTTDGRVLFFIPWLGHCLIGTTDTMVSEISHEPRPLEQEIDFLCREASRVLQTPVDPAQVQSVWAGLRPLAVGPESTRSGSGGRVSREHAIHADEDGLISVLGGKWTTCRVMAQDALAVAGRINGLPWRPGPADGFEANHQDKDEATPLTAEPGLHLYGPMQGLVQSIQGSEQALGLGLTEAMVRYAVRHEQACTVQDVLARRHRMLFLDARMAQSVAPLVARIMREEGVVQPQLLEFLDSCPQYQI